MVHEGIIINRCTRDGTAEPVDDQASIGSGSEVTEHLLQRAYRYDIPVEDVINRASFVIHEAITNFK